MTLVLQWRALDPAVRARMLAQAQAVVPNLAAVIGPPGLPGPNSIGGYGFEVTDLASGDVLSFGGEAWVNARRASLTDGGNF